MAALSDLEKLGVQLGERDNVLTALHDIPPGEYRLGGRALSVRERIPTGFKMATEPIKAGQQVLKYDSPIGVATVDIAAGTLVHTHNLASIRSPRRHEEVPNGR